MPKLIFIKTIVFLLSIGILFCLGAILYKISTKNSQESEIKYKQNYINIPQNAEIEQIFSDNKNIYIYTKTNKGGEIITINKMTMDKVAKIEIIKGEVDGR